MENIIKIFRPYIDNQENLDFVHSEKFGWIQIDKNPYAETAVFAEDKTILLSLLARWFFDRASNDSKMVLSSANTAVSA